MTLHDKIDQLTADERAAVEYVVDRILVQGRASYAPWRADGEQRDMDKEIADECADAIVYTGMLAILRALGLPKPNPAHDVTDGSVNEVLR